MKPHAGRGGRGRRVELTLDRAPAPPGLARGRADRARRVAARTPTASTASSSSMTSPPSPRTRTSAACGPHRDAQRPEGHDTRRAPGGEPELRPRLRAVGRIAARLSRDEPRHSPPRRSAGLRPHAPHAAHPCLFGTVSAPRLQDSR